MKTFLLFCLFLYSLTSSAQVATYNFSGAAGDQTSQPVASKDVNITATAITRGSGITANPGANSINSKGWTSTSQDVTDYYEFTLTPGTGYQLNLATISISAQRSAAGPTNYLVAYSIGGGADMTATSGTIPATTTTDVAINASFTIKTSQPVRFRIYAWGATSASGTFRLDNTLTVSGSAPLPVKLLSFTGQSDNNAVLLNWTTAWEDKNEGFDILKGQSAINLEKVGFIEGQATTQEISTYSFTDADVQAGQLYYYQLKQRDIGGGSEVSKIIAVRAGTGKEEIEPFVYPNPNRGSFVLSANDMNASTVSLYNSLGVEIPVAITTNQSPTLLSVSAQSPMPTGIYYLRLQPTNGTYKQSLKVIVH